MSVAELISTIRARTGWSRLELALKLGHKKQAIIWLYEHNKRYPKHTTLLKILEIARELRIDLNSFAYQAPVTRNETPASDG